jgi:predicted RNA binding protein YcfA (HicA-like mRNA interferase family)
MPKILSLTPKQVIKKLRKLGFVEHRQEGSHAIYRHRISRKRAVIPFHTKDIPKGTLSSLLREAGIGRKEFLNV